MSTNSNEFEVRLTETEEERRQVRQLRYRCFCLENGAAATDEQKALGEEWDSKDEHAEYMAVFHNGVIVATYRIINRANAKKMGGFYTESPDCGRDIRKVKRLRGNIVEMSRACVEMEYRDSAIAIRLLWVGLAKYALEHKVALVFGVASFVGTRPIDFAHAFSYLYYYHMAPKYMQAPVIMDKLAPNIDRRLIKMDILPKTHIDEKLAIDEMPPILKGYLRLGAVVSDQLFISEEFNDIDVFVMMKTRDVSRTYQKYFAGDPNAFDHLIVRPRLPQRLQIKLEKLFNRGSDS